MKNLAVSLPSTRPFLMCGFQFSCILSLGRKEAAWPPNTPSAFQTGKKKELLFKYLHISLSLTAFTFCFIFLFYIKSRKFIIWPFVKKSLPSIAPESPETWESSQTINHHISRIPSLKYLLSLCSSLYLITTTPIQVTVLIISISCKSSQQPLLLSFPAHPTRYTRSLFFK